MCIEVIVCNVSVVFLETVYNTNTVLWAILLSIPNGSLITSAIFV